MKRKARLAVTWLCMLSVFFGFMPNTLPSAAAAANSGDLIWPNPGAVKLTKSAEPTGTKGEWKITLTAEGKNLKTGGSDVVLVIDKSGSMNDKQRMAKAIDAANRFVDNLLVKDSTTRIAVVTFNKNYQEVSGFKGIEQKDALKQAIQGIRADGGTNIQAGLLRARTLLESSNAQNKVVVLLSDGEPTYSYKASTAANHTWPGGKYDFILSNFNYNTILGSGSNFSLKYGSWWNQFDQSYKINGKTVLDNGIGTISEAKNIIDSGANIYSIGLDVGSNSNATYVLTNSQNKGYYSSNSSELEKIFAELASKIAFAAENAQVTDPMGDMFNLKMKGSSVSEDDYKASQGTVTWNPATETFAWNVGNIVEGTPATLTYTVLMDLSKNPDPSKLYPTNGNTTMNYTDANSQRTAKDFEVPEVSFGKGSILVKGYKVNAEGSPVNADGEVVERPDLAEELYSNYFMVDGNKALDIGQSYSVPAPPIDSYYLKVGSNPTTVDLTLSKPSQIIWFGFTDAPSKLTIVHRAGDKVFESSEVDKAPGESVDVGSKAFPGYHFTDAVVSEGSGLNVSGGRVTGVMPGKNATITFNYAASEQSVTVKYYKEGTTEEVHPSKVVKGKTGDTVELIAETVAGYSVVKPDKVDYKFTAEGKQEHLFYYKGSAQKLTVNYVEEGTDKVLAPARSVDGVTGQTVELTAEEVAGYTPLKESDSYTFKAEGNVYTFYYKGSAQKLTVNYLEEGTDKVLAPAKTVDGVTGQTIELTAEEVAGYTPVKAKDNYTFKAEGN
ncbi:vWA domain-containing protein, partial [Paenibacillus apiarius]